MAKKKNRPAPRPETYVEPMFYNPDEVVDFTSVKPYKKRGNSGGRVGRVETAIADGGHIEIISTPVPVLPLASVENISIASQNLKVNASGSHTVDVLIDVPDIEGVNTYEIRVTEA